MNDNIFKKMKNFIAKITQYIINSYSKVF